LPFPPKYFANLWPGTCALFFFFFFYNPRRCGFVALCSTFSTPLYSSSQRGYRIVPLPVDHLFFSHRGTDFSPLHLCLSPFFGYFKSFSPVPIISSPNPQVCFYLIVALPHVLQGSPKSRARTLLQPLSRRPLPSCTPLKRRSLTKRNTGQPASNLSTP